MEKQNTMAKVGSIAFIVGVILALVGGIVSKFVGEAITTSILILLGLIVGFLDVTENETKDYLLAAVALIITTGLGGTVLGSINMIGPYLSSVLTAVMTFVIPATIIVSLKAIYALAQDA